MSLLLLMLEAIHQRVFIALGVVLILHLFHKTSLLNSLTMNHLHLVYIIILGFIPELLIYTTYHARYHYQNANNQNNPRCSIVLMTKIIISFLILKTIILCDLITSLIILTSDTWLYIWFLTFITWLYNLGFNLCDVILLFIVIYHWNH